MKSMFTSRKAKALVDIAMIVALVAAWMCSEPSLAAITRWRSSHCIMGIVLLLLMTAHILQHWRFTKALAKKKVFLKNKITAFTTLAFMLSAAGILFLAAGFDLPALSFHNVTGHLLIILIIIHLIDKFKKLIAMIRE